MKIGTTPSGGKISIPAGAREAHLHAVGLTRSGKSRFLADLIRQDIINGTGLCLIDPHGDLYELTIDWLTRVKAVTQFRKNIHPVDLSDPDTTFCFNPLHVDHPDEAYGVANRVVEAIGRVFLAKSVNETPLVTEMMTMVCVLLAQNNLPLAAAQYFMFEEYEALRKQIIGGAKSEWHKSKAVEIERMSGREYRELIASTRRRFEPFIANPQVQRMFATNKNTASIKEMMDDGHVLLFDCTARSKYVDARVLQALGIILTNQIFSTAFERPIRPTPRPFNLYIDEVQTIVSDDIERILSQCAKYGLYLTLSHQYVEQLKAAGEHVYKGVMSGTLLKAVFASTMEDSLLFTDELFSKEIDFNRVKEIETPSVVGHERQTFKSKSQGASTSQSETTAHGTSTATSTGFATVESAGMNTVTGAGSGDDLTMTESMGSATSEINVTVSGSSSMYGTSYVQSQSQAEGESEGLVPIIEWLRTHAMSLEEQRYEIARRIANLPNRHAYFYIRGQGVMGFKSRNVSDPLHTPLNTKNLLTKLVTESPWLIPTDELESVSFTRPKTSKNEAGEDPNDYMEPDPFDYPED